VDAERLGDLDIGRISGSPSQDRALTTGQLILDSVAKRRHVIAYCQGFWQAASFPALV